MSFFKLFQRLFHVISLSLMVSDLAKSVGIVPSILKLSLPRNRVKNTNIRICIPDITTGLCFTLLKTDVLPLPNDATEVDLGSSVVPDTQLEMEASSFSHK